MKLLNCLNCFNKILKSSLAEEFSSNQTYCATLCEDDGKLFSEGWILSIILSSSNQTSLLIWLEDLSISILTSGSLLQEILNCWHILPDSSAASSWSMNRFAFTGKIVFSASIGYRVWKKCYHFSFKHFSSNVIPANDLRACRLICPIETAHLISLLT